MCKAYPDGKHENYGPLLDNDAYGKLNEVVISYVQVPTNNAKSVNTLINSSEPELCDNNAEATDSNPSTLTILNPSLARFLEVVCNKKSELITYDDLHNIQRISISTFDKDAAEHRYDFSDLKAFPCLKSLVVRESSVTTKDIEIISAIAPLESVEFERCTFTQDDNLAMLNNITSISLERCLIQDYSFFRELTHLLEIQIIIPLDKSPLDEKAIDLSCLRNCTKLMKVWLEMCIVINESSLAELPELKELALYKMMVSDLSFIERCPQLTSVLLDERYIDDPVIKNNSNRILFKTNLMLDIISDSV